MASKAQDPQLLKLRVTKLVPGMFVTAIEHNGKLEVTGAGQIKSEDTINRLASSGIRYVWVDRERSAAHCGLHQLVGADNMPDSEPSQVAKAAKPAGREALQVQANSILGEAKGLIRKVLSETYEGKAVEVAPIEALADTLIESVMLDDDAFKYVSALRNKDAYLLEHSVNVAFLLVTFGKFLKLERQMLKDMAVGGILHDIGKTRVDNAILHKPAKLTPEEFEKMKLHQVYAIDLLADTPGLSKVSIDVCLMHHEKLDGRGYPRGLKGDEIPLHGRMSCIVDIYDALTATRCYKEAMSPAAAFKILLSLTPFHLDTALVYDFIRCIGVYPAGSLVELSDGRIGIVWDAKDRDVLHPVVKCFYSLRQRSYTPVTLVDLLKTGLNIERGVSPSSLEFDPAPFY